MIETVITSLLAFAATNIDDIFILMMLFLQRNTLLQNHNIVAGQVFGMMALIVISLAGMIAGRLLPREFIGLLGLFPVYLGLKSLYIFLTGKEDDEDDQLLVDRAKPNWFHRIFSPATLYVSAITIANGSDNIGVYIPLFTVQSGFHLAIMIMMFLMMTYGLIILSDYLTKHPLIASALQKTNRVIFPLVLIGLGVYILFECNTIQWITSLI